MGVTGVQPCALPICASACSDERLGLLQTVIGARGCTAAGCPTTRHEDLLSEPRSAARNVGFELGTRWSIPIEQRAVEAGTMTNQDASHWIAVIPTNRRYTVRPRAWSNARGRS